MLRNAAKKVDLPLQLKKAKDMLFSVQEQLATAKQETLRRAVKVGIASMQPEMDTVKQLVEQYNQCKKKVDELTKELNTANSTTVSSWIVLVCDLLVDGKKGKKSQSKQTPEPSRPSEFGSSIIDEIVKSQSSFSVSDGTETVKDPKVAVDSSKVSKKKKRKEKIVLSSKTTSPKEMSELPPLPIQITDTMSLLASNKDSKPLPSIFSFLHPMNQSNDSSPKIGNLSEVLNLDGPVTKRDSFYQSSRDALRMNSSLPFTDQLDAVSQSSSTLDFEDPFNSEIEKMEREDRERSNTIVSEQPTTTPVKESSIDLDELRRNAQLRVGSLLGDVLKANEAVTTSKPLFDETLVENATAVSNAASVSTLTADSNPTNSLPTNSTQRKKKQHSSNKVITVEEEVSVFKVSQLLGIPVKECLSRIHEIQEGINSKDDLVSCDVVELLAMDEDIEVRVKNRFNIQPHIMQESPTTLPPRPPVIAVMGHVDHGKTTLLDYLRKTSVAANEAGGITQAISSFNVMLDNSNRITFIDTPGHAAFATMRKRGATATDIILLIIAADDGIKEQTKEVIDIIQSTHTPFVVAVTKCGKKTVNKEQAIKRISTELLDYDIVTIPFGGDVSIVGIDSITGDGIDQLKHTLYEEGLLQEIRADRNAPGEAVVLESNMREGVGTVINTVIRWGQLKVGSVCVIGTEYGRIKQIWNSGKSVQKGYAGDTVEVSGINRTVNSGEWLLEVKNESEAAAVVSYRQRRLARQKMLTAKKSGEKVPEEVTKTVIPLILKTDVDGSIQVRDE